MANKLFTSLARKVKRIFRPSKANLETPKDKLERKPKIPIKLESQETLEFMGFNAEKAEHLWTLFSGPPPDPELDMDLLTYACFVIDYAHADPKTNSTDDWEACLKDIGINETVSRMILAGEYNLLQYREFCKHLVKEAMTMRFDIVKDIIKSRARAGYVE
ncbi:hypothetical protein TWF694_007326 [Orbilia ellipsospora]|uniref:Uncharacterized protein n=1 Tax=Orbilia ellipsospora TaxID=2528407 RepID=A0AAV9XHX5_9PEZI